MISDDEILDKFNRRMTDYFSTTVAQRQESQIMYQIRDGHVVTPPRSPYDRGQRMAIEDDAENYRVPVVINRVARYLDAIVGNAIQHGKIVEMLANDLEFDSQIDIGNDIKDYVEFEGGYEFSRPVAFLDSLTRGFGAVVTQLDTTVAGMPAGKPSIERKFFAAYDTAPRANDINAHASWCSYADPVALEDLDSYLRLRGIDPEKLNGGGDSFMWNYLEYCNPENEGLLEFAHKYYWHDHKKVYDVVNPYMGRAQQIQEAAQNDEGVYALLEKMSDALGVQIQLSLWTLDKDGLQEVDYFIENIRERTGMNIQKLERSERETKFYQQAEIIRGTVVKKAPSFCQKGHALSFIAGFYDETLGYHYGLMRSAAQAQIMQDEAMTAFHNYAMRAEVGGTVAVAGGGDGIEQLVDQLRRKRSVVSAPENGSVNSIGLPDTTQAFVSLIAEYKEAIPTLLGVPPEILATLSTKDTGEGLVRAMVERMNVALLYVMNSSNSQLRQQAYISLDLARKMVDTGDTRLIRAITPHHSEEDYIKFTKENFARSYTAVLRERPATEDAKKRDFRLLIEGAALLPEQERAALTPIIVENMPISFEMKRDAKEALAPKAPPPPDPVEQQLAMRERVASISMIEAQAAQLQGEANVSEREAIIRIEKALSEIRKNMAQSAEYQADAAKKMAETEKVDVETVNAMMKPVENIMQQ